MNADLVLELLIEATSRAAELSALYGKAKSENRDVTEAELDGLSDGAKAALDRLRADKGPSA